MIIKSVDWIYHSALRRSTLEGDRHLNYDSGRAELMWGKTRSKTECAESHARETGITVKGRVRQRQLVFISLPSVILCPPSLTLNTRFPNLWWKIMTNWEDRRISHLSLVSEMCFFSINSHLSSPVPKQPPSSLVVFPPLPWTFFVWLVGFCCSFPKSHTQISFRNKIPLLDFSHPFPGTLSCLYSCYQFHSYSFKIRCPRTIESLVWKK